MNTKLTRRCSGPYAFPEQAHRTPWTADAGDSATDSDLPGGAPRTMRLTPGASRSRWQPPTATPFVCRMFAERPLGALARASRNHKIPANRRKWLVDRSGFEPLTSAVQIRNCRLTGVDGRWQRAPGTSQYAATTDSRCCQPLAATDRRRQSVGDQMVTKHDESALYPASHLALEARALGLL
jgi:hypothetical protein